MIFKNVEIVPTLKFMQSSFLALLVTTKSLIGKNPAVLNCYTYF